MFFWYSNTLNGVKKRVKYASVLITILAVWISVVIISSMTKDANIITQLHRITLGLTVVLFLIGFGKGR